MPRSYAWRTSRVNSSCPRSRCTCPLMLPVPNASRVTLTPDFPSVAQPAAVPRAARKGSLPVPASTPAASPVFKKLRLEQSVICRPPIGHILSRFGREPVVQGRGAVGFAFRRSYTYRRVARLPGRYTRKQRPLSVLSQRVGDARASLRRSEEHTSELQSPCNLV